MVPAAALGLDVRRLLEGAQRMLEACSAGVRATENPALVLGTILGLGAKRGLDKLTLIASPGLHDLGAWLEQLIAESTGKDGKGIIPIDREEIAAPGGYGADRIFAYLRLRDAPDAAQDAAVAALETAGRPVIRMGVTTRYEIGQELMRWEIATAIAGAVIGIDPFTQPDVEASKVATRTLTEAYEKSGKLPSESPLFEARGLRLYADAKNAAALTEGVTATRAAAAVGAAPDLADLLRAHLERLTAGDYFALLAFVPMIASHEAALQRARHLVRDRKRVATCLGFGPRFLHSTGQAYKGGPPSGVFLQITCDDLVDLSIPGHPYTFGILKAAQARGDFQVLADRDRRALRVHLGSDVEAGLLALNAAFEEALRERG
jgi:transaldolase/glucose-6-phosphate isomerase